MGYTISDKQVVVSYPRQATEFRGDPEVLRIALTRAESGYERLFGPTRMKIFVEFVSRQHPDGDDVYAEAGKQTVDVPRPGSDRKNRETVCHIIIYNAPGNEIPELLSINVVHELVHCYQGFNIREDPPRLGMKARLWWIEGSAEWLAQKVYPEFGAAPDVTNWQADFIRNLGESLLNGHYSYDAMYFWHALERYTNVTRAMEFLKQLLRDPDPERAVFILEGLPNVHQLFAAYGKMMAHDAIPYQPNSSRLYKPENTEVIDTLPFNLSLYSDTFAFTPYLVRVTVPNTKGVLVRITGQTANDQIVYSPHTLEEVPDGGTISLCGFTEFPLIVSRGKFKVDGTGSVQVEVTGFDCTPGAPPPACLVGNWRLVNWPGTPSPADGEVLTFGTSGMEVDSKGMFTLRLDGIKVAIGAPENRTVQLRLNGVIYKGVVVFADLGDGKYKAASGKAELVGIPEATMQISGVPGIRDVGESLRRFLPSSGGMGESNVVFVCTSPTTMEYQISVSGQVVTYKFAK